LQRCNSLRFPDPRCGEGCLDMHRAWYVDDWDQVVPDGLHARCSERTHWL
jgi:hypothetical protein